MYKRQSERRRFIQSPPPSTFASRQHRHHRLVVACMSPHLSILCREHTHTHGAGTCRISLLFSGRRRCVYHVRRGAGRRAEPVQVTTNLESDINKLASNSRFALHGWYNDSRREHGVFSRSVMITSAQQLHGCSAADVVAPPTPLHPPSSGIRIVL